VPIVLFTMSDSSDDDNKDGYNIRNKLMLKTRIGKNMKKQ
jgi:hypothetical protein